MLHLKSCPGMGSRATEAEKKHYWLPNLDAKENEKGHKTNEHSLHQTHLVSEGNCCQVIQLGIAN